MPSYKAKKDPKRFYMICGIITAVILLVILCVFFHQRARVAPVFELKVEGLQAAQDPDAAQAFCRADSDAYAGYMSEHEGCAWVWCGEDTLYLVKPDALHVNARAKNLGFPAVTFKDEHGKKLKGWIIKPVGDSNELGRIQIGEADEYTFDSVSMTIRVSLRNGEISYKDAVYLWEQGSSVVFAVKPDSYSVIKDNIVSFVDDGGATRVCYILDTKLD